MRLRAGLALGAALYWLAAPALGEQGPCPDFLDQDLKRLHSAGTVNICRDFGRRALLIVNTASHCGFTPQFKDLETLHQTYGSKGLVVVGFPSNDFLQEADSEAQTAKVCYLNYGVTFTMTAPVSVRGDGAHPLFKHLAAQSRAPDWNFNKYLVTRDGKVVGRFGSRVEPLSPELIRRIEALL